MRSLGTPVPCEVPTTPPRPGQGEQEDEQKKREQRALEILQHDYPGWEITRRPVRRRDTGQVEMWWWARLRTLTPERAAVGLNTHWVARPTANWLLIEIVRQLALVQHHDD
jgi:hypothetical protein